MLTDMTVAVTGGSGFVGKYLISALKKLKLRVINLDISNGIDITQWNAIKDTERFDVIYHLAARSFVPDSYANPRDFYFTNVIGTLNMLELCRKHNAKMVFASSYVYGHPEYLPIDEKHPLGGFNPYAESKIIGERLCESYYRDFDLQILIVRPFNIYGVGQNDNFIIPLIIKQAKEGKINLKASKPKRDYVFIDDIVDAYLRCGDYSGSQFEIFNIGSGRSYSVLEVTDMVKKKINKEVLVSFSEESRKNEVMDTYANIDKAEMMLGWRPETELADGIERILRSSY